MTRFLVLVPGSMSHLECLDMTDEQWDRVQANDDSWMQMIDCVHPKFEDNVVEFVVDGDPDHIHQLVRDKDGLLYDYDQYFTKEQMINKWG